MGRLVACFIWGWFLFSRRIAKPSRCLPNENGLGRVKQFGGGAGGLRLIPCDGQLHAHLSTDSTLAGIQACSATAAPVYCVIANFLSAVDRRMKLRT